MNVTEDIIRDLLPAYHSDEASADTRRLVDDYLAAHPAFAKEARAFARWTAPGQAVLPAPGSIDEKMALKRAKRTLRWQQALLAIASTLSINALSLGFSFQIENGKIHAHWLTLPGQKMVVAILAVASIGFWIGYFRVASRVRRKILG